MRLLLALLLLGGDVSCRARSRRCCMPGGARVTSDHTQESFKHVGEAVVAADTNGYMIVYSL
jgi:hypothetical protein